MTEDKKRKAARALCDLTADYYEHWKHHRDARRLSVIGQWNGWPLADLSAELDKKSWVLVELLLGIVGVEQDERMMALLKEVTKL